MWLISTIVAILLGVTDARKSHFTDNAEPGVLLRLEQTTISKFKTAMQRFLPYWVNYDMNLPTEASWEFHLLFEWLSYHFKWTDIKYSKFDLNVRETEVDIVEIEKHIFSKDMRHALHIEFPMIKHFEISAHQNQDSWILPKNSHVSLVAKYIDFSIQTDLVVDVDGYLDPNVRSC